MINPRVAGWLAESGASMTKAALSDSPHAMFIVISRLAGEIDNYITPARQAMEAPTPYED
jgi:hypothetical protein